MKNKQKYSNLLAVANVQSIAVAKDGKAALCSEIGCDDCIFSWANKEYGMVEDGYDNCTDRKIEWLEDTYLSFSKKEMTILKELAQEYNYILRENNKIIVSETVLVPTGRSYWTYGDSKTIQNGRKFKVLKNNRAYSLKELVKE